MFNKVFIGVTNRCNAHCFTCNREVFTDYEYNDEMPLSTIEKILPHTEQIIYVGEMGDFIFHPQSLEIVEKTIHEYNVFMRTDTNGNLHRPEYWQQLGELMKGSDSYIRFMFDSLQNDLHRVGVQTDKVLENMKTFINAGGQAHVKTILFNFNHEEVDEMSKVFQDVGVTKYDTIRSRIYQDSGSLSAPPNTQSTLKVCDAVRQAKGGYDKIKIKECPWAKNKLCYVNEYGELKTCCHLVFEGLPFASDIDEFMRPYIGLDMFDDLMELYEHNKELINLNNEGVTVESAYNNEFNQTLIQNPSNYKICKYRCSLPNELKDKLLYETVIFQ